jgi:hypothetical protein
VVNARSRQRCTVPRPLFRDSPMRPVLPQLTVTQRVSCPQPEGLDGNGWPGSTPGSTGPRRLAKSERTAQELSGYARELAQAVTLTRVLLW